jgi:hypothetical protein
MVGNSRVDTGMGGQVSILDEHCFRYEIDRRTSGAVSKKRGPCGHSADTEVMGVIDVSQISV